MISSPKVVSIVVTYNAMPWLKDCFDSLINSNIQNHVILAIDNGSSDNTVRELKTNYSNVILIETGKNLGFGKANNIGLKWALQNDADYCFLLNQDAWIEQNTLAHLIEISQSNPNFGIVSPVHLNRNNRIDPGFEYYCLQSKNSNFLFDSFCANLSKKIYESEFINAAAWLLTKDCLNKNGGFMPIFPHYGEDLNYCERVLNSGLKIGFTPGITIIHDRDLKKRRLSFQKKFNRLYVELLGIFASAQKRGTLAFTAHCFVGILKILKLYRTQILVLLLIPFGLIRILINSKEIKKQRKESMEISPNFIDRTLA